MVEKEIFIDTSDGQYLVAVREKGKLVDFFFDLFGSKKSFYPYSTLLLTKVIRNIGNKGFFIKLPNGGTGFLSTKKNLWNFNTKDIVYIGRMNNPRFSWMWQVLISIMMLFSIASGKTLLFLIKSLAPTEVAKILSFG